MNESENETNVYGIWKTMRNVLTFGQTNDFLQNYYIYLANYNLILTPGSTYRPEHYYSNFNYKDLSLQDWRKEVLETTHRSEIKPLSDFVSRGCKPRSLPICSHSPWIALMIPRRPSQS